MSKFGAAIVLVVGGLTLALAGSAFGAEPRAPLASEVTVHVATAMKAPSQASEAMKTIQAPKATLRLAGKWTWWGYRTDRWQTWAIATQSPEYIRQNVVPFLSAYVYAQAWVWKLTAQNARMMGQCLGITWAGSGIIVSCA